MRGGVVPSEGPGIRDLGCLSGLGPSLAITLKAMIGAWCRASGHLFAVADTPEELSKLIGMTANRIRECMDSKGSRGASASDTGKATTGWVIKTIAR